MRIHLNWSCCENWDLTRSKLGKLKTIRYGNFADYYRDNAEQAKREVVDLGFTIIRSYERQHDVYIAISNL